LTKKLLILLLAFIGTTLLGQVQTIKVKKDPCSFNILVDDSLLNKKIKLADANGTGLTANEKKIIGQKLLLRPGKQILINRDSLKKDLSNVCKIGDKRLETVIIESPVNHPEIIYLRLKYIK
jgi:hypothetical protein